MKKIFIIDWSLIPVFVLSAYSGIELHVADYEGNHAGRCEKKEEKDEKLRFRRQP